MVERYGGGDMLLLAAALLGYSRKAKTWDEARAIWNKCRSKTHTRYLLASSTIIRFLTEGEAKTALVEKTEKKMAGNTDRWVMITKTSPSGKALFICRSCGSVTPAPSKTCSLPVQNMWGKSVDCSDWEPKEGEHND